jgi:hypothetical protein
VTRTKKLRSRVTREHARFRTGISRERQQPAVAPSLASEIGILQVVHGVLQVGNGDFSSQIPTQSIDAEQVLNSCAEPSGVGVGV